MAEPIPEAEKRDGTHQPASHAAPRAPHRAMRSSGLSHPFNGVGIIIV